MARRTSTHSRLSLAAVLFGLYALCMTSGAHASGVERYVVVRHADQVVFTANPLATAHLRQVSHLRMVRTLPRASAPVALFKAACLVSPGFAETRLVRENVLGLGGASRASGPSRAPPTA
jgi:hypothetical protein